MLTTEQVEHARRLLDRTPWVDGRVTAGHQSAQVKDNLQIPEGCPEHRELGDLVLAALERSPLFITAVLPLHVFPPLFNRYEPDMTFGAHVDNAIRQVTGTAHRIRTDVSCTLFLSDPESYDGGKLIMEDTYGEQRVKLPAGVPPWSGVRTCRSASMPCCRPPAVSAPPGTAPGGGSRYGRKPAACRRGGSVPPAGRAASALGVGAAEALHALPGVHLRDVEVALPVHGHVVGHHELPRVAPHAPEG